MADMADNPETTPDTTLSRRKALARLGLGAGTAYIAPALFGLNKAAADDYSYSSPPWGRPSKNKSSKGKD